MAAAISLQHDGSAESLRLSLSPKSDGTVMRNRLSRTLPDRGIGSNHQCPYTSIVDAARVPRAL